jgi:exodeoxyribonuclease VII large subunit
MPETFEYQNKQQKYYSLGELTGSIRKVIAKTYTSAYWVKTEIAKLNFYPYSGHCYPDLVEKQNNKIVAQIRATLWSGTYDLISKKFRKVTGEALTDGMTVLFLVKVVYHEHHGLSLNILDVEPSFTLGEMAREKQVAIEKLKMEGLFTRNRQLVFPLLPKSIAVISVETSKGYHDFLNIIQNNRYGYHFDQVLFPSLLQGDGAVTSIVGQLKNIAQKAELFDVVVIIRGGGGDVGLSAYDHYKLAKEVAAFPLPVITGIGHSTNETVVEMIAYANKITPTDVAYFLIEKFENFHAKVYELEQRLESTAVSFVQSRSKVLNGFSEDFRKQVKFLVEQDKGKLRLYGEYLQNHSNHFLRKQDAGLNELITHLHYKPLRIVSREKEQLNRQEELLGILSKQVMKNRSSQLLQLETKLELLKPENILKRGYSITYADGKVLMSSGQVAEGDTIVTVLGDGKIRSEIIKKEHYE